MYAVCIRSSNITPYSICDLLKLLMIMEFDKLLFSTLFQAEKLPIIEEAHTHVTVELI